jgi:hypothetical protein
MPRSVPGRGLVYYAQNAKPILLTSIWIVILERVLTVVLRLLLLAPAAATTVMLPTSVRRGVQLQSKVRFLRHRVALH